MTISSDNNLDAGQPQTQLVPFCVFLYFAVS